MPSARNSSEAVLPLQTKQEREILTHPEIQALAARYPKHKRQLQAAVKGLIGEGSAETEVLVQATKKAFDAVSGKLRSS